MDLVEKIKGMYRLLDLVNESGSNGCGNQLFSYSLLVSSIKLSVIVVDKVIIAQDSLKRFINTICPESYASLTKVDFKALDRFMIKPLGIYGFKVEIVRFLRSLNAVNADMCVDIPFIIVESLIRHLVPVYYSRQLRAVVPGQPYCPVCMSWWLDRSIPHKNVILFFIGLRTRLGMTQPPLQFVETESRSCGG